MNQHQHSDLSTQEQDWLDTYLDGTIEADAFEALQEHMLENPKFRVVMRRYLALDSALQEEIGRESDSATSAWLSLAQTPDLASPARKEEVARFPHYAILATAAALAFLLGLAFMYWRSQPTPSTDPELTRSEASQPSARGFAAIEKLYDVAWASGAVPHREGDTLGAEAVRLTSGTAEIQFFCGATMTIEGPAEITIKSAWEAACLEGAVRMQVPPAARGFKLHGPSTAIVDLGTEFGFVVREGKGHVEVFEGEIAIRHREEKEIFVKKGVALELAPDGPSVPTEIGRMKFPNLQHLDARANAQRRSSFDRWQAHRDELAKDDRLIAYYTFDRKHSESLIPNLTLPRNPEIDGAVVLAEPVDGRWPGMKSALEFRRPGARVRVNIPGEFPAFTFLCWVRIDSLDRWYNALFMGDSYETGEPHWQIRDDGKMMLSIMVDDKGRHPKHPEQSRYHHVYYSPPVWDLSMSGQWIHLASVFDPARKTVSHYANGKRLSREPIEPEFTIETLRIGNGEIGNWGQPFREDPTFAIRNLNGRMDELAIFQCALNDQEIMTLFERSHSGRH